MSEKKKMSALILEKGTCFPIGEQVKALKLKVLESEKLACPKNISLFKTGVRQKPPMVISAS
ncbi:MAG TPA: hypothetical protein VK186_00930 [Candidatus Deferrimicrobium sp.]|nr:hypothetical protein [Candidatus Deferrimicrobium sp.]